MKTYRITLKTLTAFGTPLVGDTLFGQCCWGIAQRYGKSMLADCLQGYTAQQPFLVISDAFAHGYLPLPTLPSALWQKGVESDRKQLKKRAWIAFEQYSQSVNSWQKNAKTESEIGLQTSIQPQPHNSLNRQTMTTGTGEFAPYSTEQIWYAPNTLLDLYVVLDENRMTLEQLLQCFKDMGLVGFGRDASMGLGKFELVGMPQAVAFSTKNANACLTLANTAPQNLGLDPHNSFYQLHTRFGRHGALKALVANPFKKPIILAKTAAVFAVEHWTKPFLGNGLTGVSISQPETVHQGYAPVIPVYVDFNANYMEK